MLRTYECNIDEYWCISGNQTWLAWRIFNCHVWIQEGNTDYITLIYHENSKEISYTCFRPSICQSSLPNLWYFFQKMSHEVWMVIDDIIYVSLFNAGDIAIQSLVKDDLDLYPWLFPWLFPWLRCDFPCYFPGFHGYPSWSLGTRTWTLNPQKRMRERRSMVISLRRISCRHWHWKDAFYHTLW